MEINLLMPAILVNLITLGLFLNSKLHDRYLLLIMMIGQLILISGESDKNTMKIQLSHILYAATIIIGSAYFNEFHNKLFILIILGITIGTRYIFSECLFNLSSSHYSFDIEEYLDFVDWGAIYTISFFIVIYRIFTSN